MTQANKKTPKKTTKNKKKLTSKATQPHSAVGQKKAKSGNTKDVTFPVVGIGASAGGLEAMTELLKHLTPDIGMAFVLVQHLAPEHQSMMPELLARETSLEVSEITDGLKVEPNHLYVIPPNSNLGIINNTLHLMPRGEDKKHLPIDYFFESLAVDQGSNAIGVILSGSASDGTVGLKAIRSENGITFAQTPETARYDSMPVSAIAASCVDFILSPKDIALELIHIARNPNVLRVESSVDKGVSSQFNDELEKIFILLRNRTGTDFSLYKRTTIQRRINRRMLINKIEQTKDYIRYLNSNSAEVDALFQDILINVTSFFRDPEAFEALKKTVFPSVLHDRGSDRPLRIWVPGCSTGEEVYSIVITLLEYLGDNLSGTAVQVFASDIDQSAIEKARTGLYPESITADISQERLRRFFTKVPQGYQINKRIRDLCVFARQNVTKDPPFSHLDLAACRNMLIYMNNILQRKVLQTIHYALNPGGFLLLGSSETVGASADLFAMADKEQKIYRKKDAARSSRHFPSTSVELSAGEATPMSGAFTGRSFSAEQQPVDLQQLAESIILNQYSPPGVVVSEQLEIMQFIGNTGPYIEPAPGVASLNLIKLAHRDLTGDLRIATHTAILEKIVTQRKNIRLRHKDKTEDVAIEVIPMQVRDYVDPYFLVLFHKLAEHDLNAPVSEVETAEPLTGDEKDRVKGLELELESTRDYMQAIIEDQEASNEELQAANEEIQSTNEELQSTNEELETAKEELQSTNEELITVNEELENRNVDLSTSNDDLKNIIASTELPVVMLNEALRIRFFSPQAHQLLNLIESDIGRPIGDIRGKIETGDITRHVHQVIETLRPVAIEIKDEKARWYSIRIRPYRTEDNRINGAVIVFIDITDSKILERTSRLATVVEDSNDAITVQDFNGRILAWNPKATEIYGYQEAEAVNASIDIVIPEEMRKDSKDKLAKLRQQKFVKPYETERIAKNGQRRKMLVTMSVLNDENGKPTAVATTERLINE